MCSTLGAVALELYLQEFGDERRPNRNEVLLTSGTSPIDVKCWRISASDLCVDWVIVRGPLSIVHGEPNPFSLVPHKSQDTVALR